MKRYILAIDPGLTTGFVLIETDGPSVVYSGELDFMETGKALTHYLTHLGADVDVVIERFIITQQTAKNSQAPWSLELIGVTRYLCDLHGIDDLKMQSPTDAKNFSTNSKLKALGLWHKGGKGHAMDAMRHALLYMVRQGYNDRRLLE